MSGNNTYVGDLNGSTVPNFQQACQYCSANGRTVIHQGQCPKIKAIEYYSDGTVKRVEFKEGV